MEDGKRGEGVRWPRDLTESSLLQPSRPIPREGVKIHQLRQQLAGIREDRGTSCPGAPCRAARPGGQRRGWWEDRGRW